VRPGAHPQALPAESCSGELFRKINHALGDFVRRQQVIYAAATQQQDDMARDGSCMVPVAITPNRKYYFSYLAYSYKTKGK